MADPAMNSTSAASPSAASPDTSSPTLPTLPSPSAPDVPSSPSPGHLTTSSPRAVENPPSTRAEIVDNTSADSPASSPPSAAHDSDATTSAIVLSPIGQLVESDRLKRKRSESVATSVATGLKEEDASDDEEGEEERESSAAETSGPSALAMAAVFEDERGFKLVDIVGVEILLDHLLSWPLRKKGAKVVGLIDPSLKRRLDSCPEVPGVEGAHQLFHRYPIQIKSLVDLLKWAV